MKAAIILSLSLLAGHAWAADSGPGGAPGGGGGDKGKDSKLEAYYTAKDKQDWKTAIATMREALATNPRNADYHNLYAYALRKSGTGDMNEVFKHYNEALAIDRKHRGAHEYLGEAYLMVGNVAKAKEHLAELDKLCTFGCSEFSELKKAIASYETTKTAVKQ
jgi:tetratricopeptide (TPR) repeat protein